MQKLSDAITFDQPDTVLTGISDFDRLIGGLVRGRLSAVCAPPSMGATAFALGVALNLARSEQGPVAYFALEESRNAFARRVLSRHLGIGAARLHFDTSDVESSRVVEDAARELSHLPFFLDFRPCRTVREIRAAMRDLVDPPSLVVVDPLRAIHSASASESVVRLKALAAQAGVALLLLSRTLPERRGGRIPELYDVPVEVRREAALIMAVHRPAYYRVEDNLANLTDARLIVLRSDSGSTGVIELAWDSETSSFSNTAPSEDRRSRVR